MSPKPFEDCVRAGGKVRRKSLANGKYVNICYRNGKSYAGHVHTKKGNPAAAVRN